MRIAVVGLGKLGLPVACSFANAYTNNDVVGVDINDDLVRKVNRGECPHDEPGLAELLAKVSLRCTTDFSVITDCDMTIIIVPTPTVGGEDGFSNTILEAALARVGTYVTVGHTVVVSSTVMPGSCDGPLKEVLEVASGMTVGREIGLVYSPEFVALGNVLSNFNHPDMVLIGGSPDHAQRYQNLILEVVEDGTPVFKMSALEAEITKLSLNTYLNLKIGFANVIAQICGRLPGTDASRIIEAIGADQRIGSKFLKPGLPPGGTCLPRDLRAFREFLRLNQISSELPKALMFGNTDWTRDIVQYVQEHFPTTRPAIGILGVAFKTDTPVIEESFGCLLVERFAGLGLNVNYYDPKAELPKMNNVRISFSSIDCIANSDLIVLCTPEKEFATVALQGKPTVDLWGIRESAPNVHVPWKS